MNETLAKKIALSFAFYYIFVILISEEVTGRKKHRRFFPKSRARAPLRDSAREKSPP
uniref:Uncharacterized protein n=1 Tax=Arundo donax TaxID=35708 RepID=A0A0A8Z7G3_ARUDO